jgi:peptidoglycan hydrolase-like protein with peptidoglycan-binding domain
MNETKLKKLWDKIDAKIKSKDLKPLQGIKTWEDFKSVMAKQSNRKKFWDAVHVDYASKGVFLGEWEDFEEVYGGDDNPLKKYEGVYEQSTVKLDVKVKAEAEKLIATIAGNDFTFSNNGVNTFINDAKNVEILFTQDGSGNVTGGKLTTTSLAIKTFLKGNDSLSFVKKSDVVPTTPSKPDEPESDDTSVWSCIEKFNKENNAYPLFDRDDFRFEKTNKTFNDQRTIFMYYKDGRAVWAYYSDFKPIWTGTWKCSGDNGYFITWSNGKISSFGDKSFVGTQQQSGGAETDITENICPNGYKEGCVSEEDILNKKKALKVCSKCDLVKKVQENPEIKTRIFRLQKEAGLPEKTDNVFGPIMLAAIKEYQSSHGINPTGAVGEKTLSKINSYVNPKVEEPKVNNNEPVINKTDVKNEPKIKQSEVKPTNKSQVKPIYRKSSTQVLSPDEEM